MLKQIAKYLSQYGAKAVILTVFLTSLYTVLFNFNTLYVLAAVTGGWLMYGLSMVVLHRYVSHSVFKEKNSFIRYMMYTWVVLFASGSPLSWAYSHRIHHKYTDIPPDPQSPNTVGYIKTFFSWPSKVDVFEASVVKDLLRNQEIMFIHTYYHLFLLIYFLSILFFAPVFFGYLCVSIAVSYSLVGTLNTLAHSGNKIKRVPLDIILFGEENHAWHHESIANSKVVNTSRWDVAALVIKFLADKESLTYREGNPG